MAALGEIPPIDFAINADTTWEHAHTYAHAQKWTPWLGEHGVTVVTVAGKPSRTAVVNEYNTGTKSVLIPAFSLEADQPLEVWKEWDENLQEHIEHRRGGPGTGRGQILRQCTHDWKIMPIRAFVRQALQERGIKRQPGVVHSLQGISLDEWQRMRSSDVAYIENVYPLVDMRMTRAACITWLQDHGLDVPPKSSCVFCPYKSLDAWKALKRGHAGDWKTAVGVDHSIRKRRPKCDLFVHPARIPLPEAVRVPEDFGAEQLEFAMLCDGGVCGV
jgi:hypothetical protein